MEELRDIKDIVEVNEYSFLIFLTIIITIFIVAGLLYFFYKSKRVKRKKLSKKELALKHLKEIDFSDVKNTVYTFSVDGSLWIDENNIDRFREIEQSLQKYKYQKDVPQLDMDIKKMIKEFIKELK